MVDGDWDKGVFKAFWILGP